MIKINWIPGHEGYKGNDIADRLANIGTNQETARELLEPKIPVATSVTKAYVTKWANKNTKKDGPPTRSADKPRSFSPVHGIMSGMASPTSTEEK